MELFNEMDIIKKEYYHIQNRLNREDDSCPTSTLHMPGGPKEKGRPSAVHTLKTDNSEAKKDISLLKRELTKLREDFEEFAFGVNTNPGEIKTVVIKPNENKEDWKILSTKIYKLKMEMQSGLRDM
jgi:hypothetical protein